MSLKLVDSIYGTSESLEVQGVWVTPAKLQGSGLKFKIARMIDTNRAWATEIARANRQYQNASNEVSNDVALKIFCKTILLDWDGFIDEDEQPMLYTADEGYKLLKKYKDLYRELQSLSSDMATFLREDIDMIAGKSVTISTGS